MSTATKGKSTAATADPVPGAGTAVIPAPAPQLPAKTFGDEFGDAGFETLGQGDFAIPFLSIVQGLSPQINPSEAKYIEAAKLGDIFNTVSNEVFRGAAGTPVIPVYYSKVWIEWRPRDAGGGFVAMYDTEEDAKAQAQPGNEIAETAQRFVLVQNSAGVWTEALLSLTSTKLSFSKKWNSQMRDIAQATPGPIFAHIWSLGTVQQKNPKGTFFNFTATHTRALQEQNGADVKLVQKAFAFYQMLKAGGARKVKYEQPDDISGSGGPGAPGAGDPPPGDLPY